MIAGMIEAVIFDFDGVIADSEPLHFQAFRDALAALGRTLSEADYYEKYVGLSDATLLDAILGDERRTPPADEVERLLRDKRTRYMEAIRSRRCLMPGAGRLIEDLYRRWPLAICSGALRTEVTCILDREDLSSRFGVVVTSDDVALSKPDPQGFLLTLDRLGQTMPSLAAESCIVVEDSAAGVAAARAAGMRTLGVGRGRAAERLADAEVVVPSVVDITPDRLGKWFGWTGRTQG